MNKRKIAIILGVVCFILTIGICIQLKTIKSTTSTVSQSFAEDDLRDQVLRWKEKYDNATKNLEDAEKKLEKIRTAATSNTEETEEMTKELKLNNTVLGLTDVTGTGVVITLKDNSNVTVDSISPTDNISYYLVHEEDLRTIVNELKNANAEAISINDQRIISTTSITCDGNVIMINGKKIGTPFIIKAIGSSELLYGAIGRPGGYLEALNDTGVLAEMKKSGNVSIQKYNGVISSKTMKSVESR